MSQKCVNELLTYRQMSKTFAWFLTGTRAPA